MLHVSPSHVSIVIVRKKKRNFFQLLVNQFYYILPDLVPSQRLLLWKWLENSG